MKVSAPYVMTGREHKVRKVTNAGARLCSYVPEIKNVVVSERYTLGTGSSRASVFKMVSAFAPAGIICVGLPTSTILLELFLGDRPNDFVDVLPDVSTRVERWEPISEYSSHPKCVLHFRALGIRRIIAYSM